jgi:cation transport regulator ChaC
MKVGKLITNEGVEYSLESAQLGELFEYLRRREGNAAAVSKLSGLADASGFVDPEDYERVVQAAYFTRRKNALPAAA